MKKILILVPLLLNLLFSDTVKPKKMQAIDHHRHYDRGSISSGRSSDRPLISTLEATAHASSIVIVGASSDASTHGVDSKHDPYALNFVEENRIEITQDMAKAEGEYLNALLNMLDLKNSEQHRLNIQSEFDTLTQLDSGNFITQLKAMQS